MGGIALMMFVALFGFGDEFVGWSDVDGKIKLALFASFVFGIICGWRTKG